MKNSRFYKTTLAIIMSLCSGTGLFADATKHPDMETQPKPPKVHTTDLATMDPSWLRVLSGNPICAPVRNSLGYVAIDDGKMKKYNGYVHNNAH